MLLEVSHRRAGPAKYALMAGRSPPTTTTFPCSCLRDTLAKFLQFLPAFNLFANRNALQYRQGASLHRHLSGLVKSAAPSLMVLSWRPSQVTYFSLKPILPLEMGRYVIYPIWPTVARALLECGLLRTPRLASATSSL